MKAKIIRGRIPWYSGLILSGMIFIIGIIVTATSFITTNSIKNREYLTVPGRHELELSETGKYTVFYEYLVKRTTGVGFEVRQFNKLENPSAFVDIAVYDKLAGAKVDIYNDSSTKYHINRISAESIYSFKIDHPGRYVLVTKSTNPDAKEPIKLTITTNIAEDFIRIFKSMGITFLLTAFGIVATFIYRSRQKK